MRESDENWFGATKVEKGIVSVFLCFEYFESVNRSSFFFRPAKYCSHFQNVANTSLTNPMVSFRRNEINA